VPAAAACGAAPLQVAKKTDIFEGSIIRVARRLDELMQQLARAARVVGDETLAARFEESNETLRRGIMFSASLYL
jgi:ATP-dependent RNA helicase DOB1